MEYNIYPSRSLKHTKHNGYILNIIRIGSVVKLTQKSKTTIAVFPETRDKLAKFADYKDESFDDILKRLMDFAREHGMKVPTLVSS